MPKCVFSLGTPLGGRTGDCEAVCLSSGVVRVRSASGGRMAQARSHVTCARGRVRVRRGARSTSVRSTPLRSCSAAWSSSSVSDCASSRLSRAANPRPAVWSVSRSRSSRSSNSPAAHTACSYAPANEHAIRSAAMFCRSLCLHSSRQTMAWSCAVTTRSMASASDTHFRPFGLIVIVARGGAPSIRVRSAASSESVSRGTVAALGPPRRSRSATCWAARSRWRCRMASGWG